MASHGDEVVGVNHTYETPVTVLADGCAEHVGAVDVPAGPGTGRGHRERAGDAEIRHRVGWAYHQPAAPGITPER